MRHWWNEAITEEPYRIQLIRLSLALHERWSQYEKQHEKMILQHDNAWPHVAKPIKTYLEKLKWEVLPACITFTNIESSDYYFIPFDGTLSSWSAVLLIWRYHKMALFVESRKRRALLPSPNSSSIREMGDGKTL